MWLIDAMKQLTGVAKWLPVVLKWLTGEEKWLTGIVQQSFNLIYCMCI